MRQHTSRPYVTLERCLSYKDGFAATSVKNQQYRITRYTQKCGACRLCRGYSVGEVENVTDSADDL